ncbi:MAG: tRNA anti-like [Gemmataceae bacterium]|nr:tRNA anti-like [Gemmataceae bacterium]
MANGDYTGERAWKVHRTRRLHMRSVQSVGAAWFLCVGLVLADDTPQPGPKPKDTLPAADFKLTAGEFAKEFRKDAKAAREKYKGKIVELNSTVSSAALGYEGKNSYVGVETPDPAVKFGNPEVMCLSNDPEFFAQFGRGQTARIKGKVGPGGSLMSCEVVEKGADTRILVSSETLAKDFTADPEKALAKYERKTLVVSGKISAIKPYPGLKVKYLELTGDDKMVIECRYSEPNVVEKYQVGQTVKVYGAIATSGKGVINIALCYPLAK